MHAGQAGKAAHRRVARREQPLTRRARRACASLMPAGLIGTPAMPALAATDNFVANNAAQMASQGSLSAQDLFLFGILALGIIGLLWVRRHTSEL